MRRAAELGVLALAIHTTVAAGCDLAAGPRAPSPASAASPISTTPSGNGPAAETPRPAITALSLTPHSIDPRLTTPLLAAMSDGTEIVYSSGAADGPTVETAPDLYRYLPGHDAPPEMVFRNPDRDAVLQPIDVDAGRYAFVDAGVGTRRPWRLWLLPRVGGEPLLLDEGASRVDVPDFVPSFDLAGERIVWTSFAGTESDADGSATSELWMAVGPAWRPRRVMSVPAGQRELWLPSLRGDRLAYVEVVYSQDRSTDERHVMLIDLADPGAAPRRLDSSGRATMPVLVDDLVIWKENEPGFNMFSWGSLVRHSLAEGSTGSLSTIPQEEVNYPSAGNRFVGFWGADSTDFALHDLERRVSRPVVSFDPAGTEAIVRPHVAGDLVVFIYAVTNPDGSQAAPLDLQWARLPAPGEDG